MKQYQGHQIYINYNTSQFNIGEAVRENFDADYQLERNNNPALRAEIKKERDEYFLKTGVNPVDLRRENALFAGRQYAQRVQARSEITAEENLSETARKYEEAVIKRLDLISKNQVGLHLLNFLNTQKKVWILPYFEENSLTPKTFAGETVHDENFTYSGGGIRIYFYPWEEGMKKSTGYDTDDDILFHELVHAYRDGHLSYGQQWYEPVDNHKNYTNAEEFIALCLQNMYRSSRGDRLLYESYGGNKKAMARELEAYMSSKDSIIRILKKAQERDPFIRMVKNWTLPEFNPWRDFESLAKDYYRKDPSLNMKRMTPLRY